MSPDHAIVAQIINLQDGTRSQPVTTDPETFAAKAVEAEFKDMDKYAILIIMEKGPDLDWEFSQAPFIKMEGFIQQYTRTAPEELTAHG